MKIIWKYHLLIQPILGVLPQIQILEVPKGYKILHIDMQQIEPGKSLPTLWIMVNPKAKLEKIFIESFGTGHLIPDGKREYIGSYLIDNGILVGHVFINNDDRTMIHRKTALKTLEKKK